MSAAALCMVTSRGPADSVPRAASPDRHEVLSVVVWVVTRLRSAKCLMAVAMVLATLRANSADLPKSVRHVARSSGAQW